MKILKETENRLFNRKELILEEEHKGSTPSKTEIKKAILGLTKSKEDTLVLDKIHQVYGTTKVKINAKVYSSPEDLKHAEVLNKKPKKKQEKKKE